MTWTLQALQGLTCVLIVILIAIVVIGIMNTMWIAIRERTREIGTLRAIGMHRRGVLWMFLLESLMLGLRRHRGWARCSGAAIAAGSTRRTSTCRRAAVLPDVATTFTWRCTRPRWSSRDRR